MEGQCGELAGGHHDEMALGHATSDQVWTGQLREWTERRLASWRQFNSIRGLSAVEPVALLRPVDRWKVQNPLRLIDGRRVLRMTVKGPPGLRGSRTRLSRCPIRHHARGNNGEKDDSECDCFHGCPQSAHHAPMLSRKM
jgi:hypothetical protein